MKILITGGLGFIGSNFCRYILTDYPDIEVINIDKIGMGANLSNLKDFKKEKRYNFVKGNICNSKLLNKKIMQVDAVVNIAAETHVDRSIAKPNQFIKNNTLGTFTILEAIRKYNDKIKLVQVSTDEVYGDILEGSFKESDAPEPSNPYSASKAAADMFVTAYSRTYGINASITRCTNNYGPYQLPEKLIPKTIIRAIKNLQIPIYGSGKNIRDWIYVKDHYQAIDFVLRKGNPNEIYNISSRNEIPNIEIVRKILNLMDKPEDLISFVEDRPGHDARYSLDSSKIRTELNWKPKSSFEEALKATVEWYLQNSWWWKSLATKKILRPTPWKK
jgi:dTDP-glucose 4,6-dehydratase